MSSLNFTARLTALYAGPDYVTSHHITSHHMKKTEAGLKGLYIREITLKYRLYNIRITAL